jgi:hypothetical protein
VRELKVVDEEDGWIALVHDPVETARMKKKGVWVLPATLGPTMVLAGLAGLLSDPSAVAFGILGGTVIGGLAMVAFVPMHPDAWRILRVDHVGLRLGRAYGGSVRLRQVLDGTHRTRRAPLAAEAEEEHIPWTELSGISWTDASLTLERRDGRTERFDLEDYPRADIERLGGRLKELWARYEQAAPSPEEAERARAQLAAVAQRSGEKA